MAAGCSRCRASDTERALRNTVGHLDETNFDDLFARRGMLKKGKQSIDDLPGKELFLGFKQNYLDYVFGIVNLADVTEKARQYCYLDRDDREFEPDPDDLHHDFEADDDEP